MSKPATGSRVESAARRQDPAPGETGSRSPRDRAVSSWVVLGLLSAISLLALFLRLGNLGGPPLWVDEAMTVVFAAKPLQDLFLLLVTEDIHPPLYPLLLHYWMAIAGDSEVAVRLPSVILGVLLIPLIYLTGRELEASAESGRRPPVSLVGLVGAIIAATSTFYIGYSREARNYMAVTFMGLLSSYLLLRALSDSRRGNWIPYGLATTAALYTHYTAFLLLAFHALFVATTRVSFGRAWRCWAISILAAGAAYLPWLGYSMDQLQRISDYWPGTLQLDAALRTSLLTFVAGGAVGQDPTSQPVLLGLALLAAGLLALAVGVARRRRTAHILFLLLYLVVPAALLFAIAYYRPKFDPRYLLVATPAFYLTLAWGIASLLGAAFSRRLPILLRATLPCLGAAALAGAVAVSAVYGEPEKLMHVGDGRSGVQEYGDYRSLVAYLEGLSQPGDAVVTMMNTYHPYVYYRKLDIPYYPMEPFDDFDGAIIRLNRMAEKQSRLWFILWQTQWADPANYVMHVMETETKEIPLDRSFGKIGLRLFELKPGQRFSYYPRVEHKVEALFDDRLLEFWGWNVSALEAPAGGSIQFDLHWRPLRKTDAKLKTKVMIMDDSLRQYGNFDEIMVSPYYPASRFKEQEIIHDPHRLTIPPETPPGSYHLMLLVYDENTLRDFVIEKWSGEKVGTLLPLGRLAVTPAQKAPR